MLEEMMDDEDEVREMNLSSRPLREERRRQREIERIERGRERCAPAALFWFQNWFRQVPGMQVACARPRKQRSVVGCEGSVAGSSVQPTPRWWAH